MYAAIIYQSRGWHSGNQAFTINGIQAVLQFFIALVNTFTVDRFGRRALLIAGFLIQALALLILSSLTTAFPDNDNKPAAIMCVVCLFVVGMIYCLSNGPAPPVIASKIFPQEVRDQAFGFPTKCVFLEHMDQIFGEVDAVAAGEEKVTGKVEAWHSHTRRWTRMGLITAVLRPLLAWVVRCRSCSAVQPLVLCGDARR